MKVLLVNGSPHQHGCTDMALQETAKELEKQGIHTEIFWVGAKPISGCMGCGACKKGLGKCVVEDTVNQFTTLAAQADGFIFGSPVHYAAISGAMTSFMDRAFYSGGQHLAANPAAADESTRRRRATPAIPLRRRARPPARTTETGRLLAALLRRGSSFPRRS